MLFAGTQILERPTTRLHATKESSKRCWLYFSVDSGSGTPHQHLQIACWAGRNARTARTAALGAGSSQQGYASRPNRGLPAGAPVPSGGSGTQAQIGAAGAAEDAPKAESGLPR